MNIGFFTQNISKGGLDTFLKNLLSTWPQEYKIYLFCNKSHPGLDDLRVILADKIMMVEYDFIISQDIFPKFFSSSKIFYLLVKCIFWFFGFPYMIWHIRKLLNQYSLHNLMVINGGYPGGDACLAACIAWSSLNKNRSKPWLNFHNLTLPYSINPLRYLKEFFIDFLVVKSIGGLVTVSKSSLNSLSMRPKLLSCQSCFIYNGIKPLESNIFNLNFLRLEFDIPENSNIILMLSTYEERKGHHFLFNALNEVLKSHSNFFLLVFGSGSIEDYSRVQNLLRDSNCCGNVFLGTHRNVDANFFNQIDILVVPSQSQESFGYTAIEAMSCGVPVVCTDAGGLPEVVDNGVSGYVVDKNNFIDFGLCLVNLLEDPIKRKKMGEEGKKRVEQLFNAKFMTQQYVELINK